MAESSHSLLSTPQPSAGAGRPTRSTSHTYSQPQNTDSQPHEPLTLSSSLPHILRRVRTLSVFQAARDETRRSRAEEPEWTIFGQLLRDSEEVQRPDTVGRSSTRSLFVNTTPSRLAKSKPLPLTRIFSNGSVSGLSSPDSLSTIHSPLSPSFARFSTQRPDAPDPNKNVVSEQEPSRQPATKIQLPSLGQAVSIITFSFLSRASKDIIKCVLAYFVASLFTFVPALSSLIASISSSNSSEGASPSAHMVATIAVYFLPAKTIGAMVEADIFCITASLFTAIVSLLAMGNFWLFELLPGWEWLADASILLWLGTVMSFIAFAKLWMNKPSFNPACSMAVVTLSIVIVKEGGLETLLHVLFVILIGTSISNVVCFAFWPESAITRLQTNMSTSLVSLSTLLRVIGESFLAGNDTVPDEDELSAAVSGYQAVFTKLKSGLGEAHSEWADPRLAEGADYEAAIESFTHLAQHMTGLRDGAKIRNELRHPSRANWAGHKPDAEILEDNAMLAVFESVQRELSQPLTALVDACCTSLRGASKIFEPRPVGPPLDFTQMAEEIDGALDAFVDLSNQAVLNLYRGSEATPVEERARNEAVFNVYFFIFTLQEFAKETNVLLESISRIWHTERRISQESILGSRTLGHFVHVVTACFPTDDVSREKFEVTQKLRRRMSTLLSKDLQPKKELFPALRPHATNTAQTPARESLPWYWRLKRSLWGLGARLKQPDVKYALKTGMATALLAAPAFFESTRPLFLEYRGEWALISFFVVMGPTIGATNALGLQRILGTILGAFVAGIFFALFPDDPVLLAILGALFSVPCFWLVVKRPKHATSARFILLTYNLTCLYAYNSRTRDVGVEEIAVKRSIAVIAGVVWAFIVSRWWWPLEARRQLGVSLSEFCQEIGWLYNRLVRTYSIPPRLLFPQQSARSEPLSVDQAPLIRDASYAESYGPGFNSLELHLQMKLLELQSLLSQTENEPRLKGPFPVKLYRSVLTSLQVILDKLHSMRCVTMREEWFAAVHRDFIMPVQRERREMVGNVILYFSTLSAAFRLKSPLPPYMPPAEQSRLRLIEVLRSIDTRSSSKDSRHLLYYAYASSMQGVIQELERLGKTLQDTFGVIGESTAEFEALFDNSRLESAVASSIMP